MLWMVVHGRPSLCACALARVPALRWPSRISTPVTGTRGRALWYRWIGRPTVAP